MSSTIWEVIDAHKGYYDDWRLKNGVSTGDTLSREDIDELREMIAEDARKCQN